MELPGTRTEGAGRNSDARSSGFGVRISRERDQELSVGGQFPWAQWGTGGQPDVSCTPKRCINIAEKSHAVNPQ